MNQILCLLILMIAISSHSQTITRVDEEISVTYTPVEIADISRSLKVGFTLEINTLREKMKTLSSQDRQAADSILTLYENQLDSIDINAITLSEGHLTSFYSDNYLKVNTDSSSIIVNKLNRDFWWVDNDAKTYLNGILDFDQFVDQAPFELSQPEGQLIFRADTILNGLNCANYYLDQDGSEIDVFISDDPRIVSFKRYFKSSGLADMFPAFSYDHPVSKHPYHEVVAISISTEGYHVNYQVTDIQLQKFDESLFHIPADYTAMSEAEFRKLFNTLSQ